MPTPAENRDLLQLAEQQFSRQQEAFLGTFRAVTDGKLLVGLAERWASDPHPWAREQFFAYLAMPPNRIGHQAVIKRLFKLAESREDDPQVAAFALLFDRLVRHRRKLVVRYDWSSQQRWEEEVLATEAPKLPGYPLPTQFAGRFRGEPAQQLEAWSGAVYFSHPTRYYLQRRACRYFRRLGYRDGERYLLAAADLLARYEDQHLAQPEYLLDCWTLMHVAFGHHPALHFTRDRVRLTPGHSLAELSPAPMFPHLWQSDTALSHLLSLVAKAESRLVKVWAIQILEREHAEAIDDLPLAQLLELLTGGHPDVEQFAARWLKSHPSWSQLTASQWLEILATRSLAALEIIVQAARQHLSSDQLTFDQVLRLALQEPTPVAQFGFELLQLQSIDSADRRLRLAELASGQCLALIGNMSRWALLQVGSHQHYDRDAVTSFFDSLHLDARKAAWEWLDDADSPGRDDPLLFCRLMETPYTDLRLKVIDLLERRSIPGDARQGLEQLWIAVLLGVERGGRQKLKATEQIAEAILREPDSAPRLLPVLITAVRSIRHPEARAGLSAVVRLAVNRPDLALQLAEELPELVLLTPAEARA